MGFDAIQRLNPASCFTLPNKHKVYPIDKILSGMSDILDKSTVARDGNTLQILSRVSLLEHMASVGRNLTLTKLGCNSNIFSFRLLKKS